jgi:hypothetical protein
LVRLAGRVGHLGLAPDNLLFELVDQPLQRPQFEFVSELIPASLFSGGFVLLFKFLELLPGVFQFSEAFQGHTLIRIEFTSIRLDIMMIGKDRLTRLQLQNLFLQFNYVDWALGPVV